MKVFIQKLEELLLKDNDPIPYEILYQKFDGDYCEVDFDYDMIDSWPSEPATENYPGCESGWEIDILWDKSKYTKEENEAIEASMEEVYYQLREPVN